MSDKAKATIGSCIIVVMLLGTLNSVYKSKKLPGLRFYIGNGVLWILLTMFGRVEEELTKSVAVAIAVFAVLGEGGGILDHFLGKGASSTTLDTTPKEDDRQPVAYTPMTNPNILANPAVAAAPGLFPAKPVIPNHTVVVPI